MYSPAVGPCPATFSSAAISYSYQLLLPLSVLHLHRLWFSLVAQSKPVHLHGEHQANQHCRPTQPHHQTMRREQHDHRHQNLDQFPDKEAQHRRTCIDRSKLSRYPSCKERSGNDHRHRTASHRQTNYLSACYSPCNQRDQRADHHLTHDHPPGRNCRIFSRSAFACSAVKATKSETSSFSESGGIVTMSNYAEVTERLPICAQPTIIRRNPGASYRSFTRWCLQRTRQGHCIICTLPVKHNVNTRNADPQPGAHTPGIPD